MLELIGDAPRVLDLGCATGSLGRVLRERGCHVVGVERDPEAARVAAELVDEVVVADLENPDLWTTLRSAPFDAVVFGDVLEHLRDPLAVLVGATSLLGPEGIVVASVPNIAHAAVRLSLLAGRFDYRPLGLLDETHIRFFTRSSLRSLLVEARLTPIVVERTTAGAFATEIPLDAAEFPTALVRSVEGADEAMTYQFVFKAVRSGEGHHDPDSPWKISPTAPPTGLDLWAEQRRLSESLIRSVARISRLLPPDPPPAKPDYRYLYGLDAAEDQQTYLAWLSARATDRERERQRTRDRLASLETASTISVLVPVYKPVTDLLRRCVESVRCQDFGGWELCLCDDGSDDPELTTLLQEFEASDPRIRVAHRPLNGGISAATNSAADLATGGFLAFLDQDDELEPGALAEVAVALAGDSEIDVLYTDEDKLEPDGTRSEPFFKPDWCPDQLLSHMYIGHLLVVRRSLFEDVGRLRSELDGSQDYDLALRVTERARKIAHLPMISYHWRKTAGSTAQNYRAKPGADIAARAAVLEALARRGEDTATVESGLHESTFRVRRAVKGSPLVSVVIPFHNGGELLRRCVTSLQRLRGHDRWEAILVDNRSWEPETRAVLSRLGADPRCRIISYPEVFNWAAINNFAVQQSEGDHVLFLNADVEGTSEEWMLAMLEHSQRQEVGAVGARLLYPDQRIQHAGVVMGLGAGVAWHAFCFCPGDRGGYFGQAKLIRNYSAVTGACMMVRRETFERVGGFDEGLPVAYNDIDFCLRLRQLGYLIVYTPFAELVHEESAARGFSSHELPETSMMFARWETEIRRDPYFNRNLDPRRSEFCLPAGIEEVDPWAKVFSRAETWLNKSGTRSPSTQNSKRSR